MDKTTRKAVLYSLFGLFFVLGAAAIFYAQGYRFDVGTLGLNKVGAIYVRTYPKSASLTMDGLPIDRGAMLLSSGTLVQDLFPKTHELAIEAPGFTRWTRQVSVKPAMVTEIQAILLPEKPELVREKAPLKFWALSDTPLIEFLPGLSYSGQKIPGYFAEFNADRSQVLTKDASKKYFLTTLSSATLIPQKLSGLLNGVIIFDKTPGQFISYTAKTLEIFSPGTTPSVIFSAPLGQTVAAAETSRTLIAFVTMDNQNKSSLWLYEKLSGSTKKIDSAPGKTTDFKFSPSGQVAMLQDTKDFYLYDPSNGNLSKTASAVKSFSFSEDGSALAILSEKTLEAYTDAGYSRLNLAFLPGINKVFWYGDNQHLFLQFGDHLGLLDLIDFQPENVQFINKSTENSYDPVSNSLYFIKDSGLYRFVFPS